MSLSLKQVMDSLGGEEAVVKFWEKLEQAKLRYDAEIYFCTREGISVKEHRKRQRERPS